MSTAAHHMSTPGYMPPPPSMVTGDNRPPSIYNMESAKAFLNAGGTKLFLLALFLLFVGIMMIVFAATSSVNSNPKNVKAVYIILGIVVIFLCFLLFWAGFAQWASSRAIYMPENRTVTVPYGTYFPPPGSLSSGISAAAPPPSTASASGYELLINKPPGEAASVGADFPSGQHVDATFGANRGTQGAMMTTGGGGNLYTPGYSYVYDPNTGNGGYTQQQPPQLSHQPYYYRAGGNSKSSSISSTQPTANASSWPYAVGGGRRSFSS